MTLVAERGNEILRRMPERFRVVGAEVGVYDGRLSQYLLRQNINLTLLMVDRWAAVPPDHRYAQSGSKIAMHTPEGWKDTIRKALSAVAFAFGRYIPIRGESVEIATHLPPAFLDFVFVDADHCYEGVKEDLAAWWPLVRPGGFIGGHDWDHPEDHIGGAPGKQWGVRQAVEEFFPDAGVEIGANRTWFKRKHHEVG